MGNVDVETIFNAPKKKPEDDPVLDRMLRDTARHATAEINAREIRLDNKEENARQGIINLGHTGHLSPMQILAFEEELHEIEDSRKDIRDARKEVARMRTKKSRALAKKALIEKRAKAKRAKRKKILNKMKGK